MNKKYRSFSALIADSYISGYEQNFRNNSVDFRNNTDCEFFVHFLNAFVGERTISFSRE